MLNCEWGYDKENPIDGMCLSRNFSTTSLECSVLLNKTDVKLRCPNVDECGLGIHDCHPKASCSNTHGSYQCQCRKGFVSDGKKNCAKTCFEKCIQGTCFGAPDYVCNYKLFNSQHLSDNLEHPWKTFPRFGHSLVCDKRDSLWIFSGYSMSIEPLK